MPEPTSAQYRLTIRVRLEHKPGYLGRATTAIGDAGGTIGAIDLIEAEAGHTVRDVAVDTAGPEHGQRIVDAIDALEGIEVLGTLDRTFRMHLGGKIEVTNRSPVRTRDDLSMAYTPGVARVCSAIHEDPSKAFQYTIKRNTVAVVSDGSAVLGLGNIGPEAAMPVMEGKAMLFKEFGGVDAFPICLATQDADEIVAIVRALAPTFGGINLEDISAPRCFEIEDRLKTELDIPVFHDDQHGTAVVVLAALLNACTVTGRELSDVRALVVGLGAAGVAVSKIMLEAGVADIVGCDSRGAVSTGREDYQDGSMPAQKRWFAEHTNREGRTGTPADVIDGMDLFVGLSGARVMEPEALARMSPDAMVFAMANPNPEIAPEECARYARVVATGRSDYPNQINNVLCFPGIFRGALDVRATAITENMKMAAAEGIAAIVGEHELREDYIIPSVFNRDVAPAVADSVAREARAGGQATAGSEPGYATDDFGVPEATRPTPFRTSQ